MKITKLDIEVREMRRRRLKECNGLKLFKNFTLNDLEDEILAKFEVHIGEEFDLALFTGLTLDCFFIIFCPSLIILFKT